MTKNGYGDDENNSQGKSGGYSDDETRQIGPVTGGNYGAPGNRGGGEETRFFGAGAGSGSGQDPQRPRQYFPEPDEQRYSGEPQAGPQSQYQPGYPQPGYAQQGYEQQGYAQPGYEPGPGPREFEPEPGQQKRGGAGMAGVFAALAALAVVAAGALFFMWRNAAAEADKPAPAPVTETLTTQVPTTVTETYTEEAPENNFPSEIPTELPSELPSELRDSLDNGGQELEGLFNDFFGPENSGGQQ